VSLDAIRFDLAFASESFASAIYGSSIFISKHNPPLRTTSADISLLVIDNMHFNCRTGFIAEGHGKCTNFLGLKNAVVLDVTPCGFCKN
jgi:hypothetical protein